MALTTGDKAPDFSLVADNGKPFKLSSKIKNKVLLLFYPGDGTPVCERQMSEYRDGAKELEALGVDVIAVSGNDHKASADFKKSLDLPFTLLSDTDGAVAKQYEAFGWYGIKRAVYLMDSDMEIKFKHIEPVSIFSRSLEELTDMIKRKS